MENVTQLFKAKNDMILNGEIVEATQKFFAPHATTHDHYGSTTPDLAAEIKKLEGFVGSIAKVDGITLHQAANSDTVSFAEYTFDFDMKDGSKILWHEIIRSVWENGLIVDEQYFIA
jgi:hypothetical protein